MPDVIQMIVGEHWVTDFIPTTRKLIDGNIATDAIDIKNRPAIILFKHKYITKFERVLTTPPGYGGTMCFVWKGYLRGNVIGKMGSYIYINKNKDKSDRLFLPTMAKQYDHVASPDHSELNFIELSWRVKSYSKRISLKALP